MYTYGKKVFGDRTKVTGSLNLKGNSGKVYLRKQTHAYIKIFKELLKYCNII